MGNITGKYNNKHIETVIIKYILNQNYSDMIILTKKSGCEKLGAILELVFDKHMDDLELIILHAKVLGKAPTLKSKLKKKTLSS